MNSNSFFDDHLKRLFDLFAAAVGLVVLSPLLLLIAIAIRLDSRGPVLHRGLRMGRGARPFGIFKFRTMVADAAQRGGGITHLGDPRITRVGRLLRRTKLDELPQLIDVLRGEMSLVGPRPEDPRYLQYYTTRQRQTLQVRPGVTSVASLRYRNEEQLLAPEQWETTYVQKILPAKLEIELNYLARRSLGQDLLILLATCFAVAQDEALYDRWTERVNRLEDFVGRYATWVVVDSLLIALGYGLALAARSVDTRLNLGAALLETAFGISLYILSNYLFQVYRRFWRYASGEESMALLGAATLATAALAAIDLLMQQRDLPLSVIGVGGFFSFTLMGAVRYRRRLARGAWRMLGDLARLSSGRGARVLIVGAGDEGEQLARRLQSGGEGQAYQVVGFIDADRHKLGLRIHNVPVYGDRTKIPEVAARLHADVIILAIAPARIQNPRELLALCRETQAQIKIVPSVAASLAGRSNPLEWEDASEEYLLQRAARQMDEATPQELLEGKMVLVTGAAGSIGSELCRQIAVRRPARLILLDTNESGLYDLMVELQARAAETALELALVDITNRERVESLFARRRPQIVFHAAAYKHVPILENHPHEGVRVNVQGTRLLHAAAAGHGAERFVFISSDKAVNPVNVLGMTKWLGEVMVTQPRRGEAMVSTVVRFGNVLGSRGSVGPLFERQIEMGGPVTITHPEMTRYFLSIGEAVRLVIQAAFTSHGDLCVLDMGTPVSILELAERMIRARGLRPGTDIRIETVGLRPGEKMTEELVAQGEEREATVHPSIYRISRTHPLNLAGFEGQLDTLIGMSLNGASPERVRSELRDLVEGLRGTQPAEWEAGKGPGRELEPQSTSV